MSRYRRYRSVCLQSQQEWEARQRRLHTLPGRSFTHHTHSGAKYCNWHPIIWLRVCLCVCVHERLCRNRPVRKAATSETAVLEIAGTRNERSSFNWEEEEAEEEADTGETTPWTAWTLWAPDPRASHLTPLLKAAARVGNVIYIYTQT